ncbi:LuxR C-terminal-related transcriptional regulator [Streptomyces laculatispora]|uniref:LuxR C-terminal-related transcriptional regulator n=1 Tax=Streptomyces laculatispora TaxID=887464 RepID=A0ABY9IBM1_9ACTN|nr:LuxR C-terminal-related transcriptional regulator [Streptomyces laculatispora]WLQ44300.1 LuxR C-terminal-related transcriptional regulator [Streptomyces laculatispora]
MLPGVPSANRDDGLRAAVTLREAHAGLPVVVLSQYVERSYAARLLDSCQGAAVGHLLKERVGAVADFMSSLDRVATGGTVVDPEVIHRLVMLRPDPLSRLSTREREVLGLMPEGRSNANTAAHLFVSEAAVSKHIGCVFSTLDLPVDTDGHRRVPAVLAFLRTCRLPATGRRDWSEPLTQLV